MSDATDTPNLSELLAPLRERPADSAVLTDLDGTLAPIVARPERAEVPAEAADLLWAIAQRYALAGCVSGRRAGEARRIVAVDGLFYIGNHGFERLEPGASEAVPARAIHEHGDAASSFVERHLDPGELEDAGLRLEDKGAIRALHWRGAPDEAAAESRARSIAADAIGFNLVPHWGRKVLELRPPVGLDKGTAVAELLEERGIGRALYAGDDRTDVTAFSRLRDMRTTSDLEVAVCIAVSSEEGPEELRREADAAVDGPEGFLDVLRGLAE